MIGTLIHEKHTKNILKYLFEELFSKSNIFTSNPPFSHICCWRYYVAQLTQRIRYLSGNLSEAFVLLMMKTTLDLINTFS